MSASGKSSNRLYEYNRGRAGHGHGIYALAGQQDAHREATRLRIRCPVHHTFHHRG